MHNTLRVAYKPGSSNDAATPEIMELLFQNSPPNSPIYTLPCNPRGYKSKHLDHTMSTHGNNIAQRGESRGSPFTAASQGPMVLSDDEIVRLSDEWLSDEAITLHFSALCDEFASAIPVVAETVEDLSKKTYDMSQILPIIKNREGNEGVPSRTRCQPLGNQKQKPSTNMLAQIDPYSQGRREFKCIKCRRTHDRAARARDCANQDLGLTPYQCKGACGNVNCSVAYSSEECWRRHLAPHVQCPHCRKLISKQNFARHREFHCPSRRLTANGDAYC